MEVSDLINYKALSRLLTNNDNSIRKGKTPKKYKDQVTELEALLTYYISKHNK